MKNEQTVEEDPKRKYRFGTFNSKTVCVCVGGGGGGRGGMGGGGEGCMGIYLVLTTPNVALNIDADPVFIFYEGPAKSFVTGFGLLQCYVSSNIILLQTFKVFPLY